MREERDLYNDKLIAKNVNILVDELPKKVLAKIRYRAIATKATLNKIDNDTYEVIFDNPVKSITKGQSVVFYDNDICLGGGIIFK